MGILDKITGRAKQAAGDLADDASLRRQGKREEEKGEKKEQLDHAQAKVEDKAAEVSDLERKTSRPTSRKVVLLKLLGSAEAAPCVPLLVSSASMLRARTAQCAVLMRPASTRRSVGGSSNRWLKSSLFMRSKSSASQRNWDPKFRGFRRRRPH